MAAFVLYSGRLLDAALVIRESFLTIHGWMLLCIRQVAVHEHCSQSPCLRPIRFSLHIHQCIRRSYTYKNIQAEKKTQSNKAYNNAMSAQCVI